MVGSNLTVMCGYSVWNWSRMRFICCVAVRHPPIVRMTSSGGFVGVGAFVAVGSAVGSAVKIGLHPLPTIMPMMSSSGESRPSRIWWSVCFILFSLPYLDLTELD